MKMSPRTAWNVAVKLQKVGLPIKIVNIIHSKMLGV